eukprot:Gb_26544 [translate_table: standard]
MASIVPLVVPLSVNAHGQFLRDEPQHTVNDNYPTCADAKQFTVARNPRQPVQKPMIPLHDVDDGRDEDSNSALLMSEDRDLNNRRKVQWNDSHGKELTSVWKFQPSDSSDSDKEEDDHFQACSCVIM